MKNSDLFNSEYPIESGIILSSKITKKLTDLVWSISIGLDAGNENSITMKGEGKSVEECMTRMRNLLLGMKDAIEDTVIDVKTFAYDEFNEDEDDFFGGKNAKLN